MSFKSIFFLILDDAYVMINFFKKKYFKIKKYF
jgi:hypothetical protein